MNNCARPITISRAKSDGITGDELLAFINNEEATLPNGRKGTFISSNAAEPVIRRTGWRCRRRKTAHWLFDRGFWSLTDDCRVLVAAHRFEEAGEPAQLLKPRAGHRIYLPQNSLFRPDPACLHWHRERHGF